MVIGFFGVVIVRLASFLAEGERGGVSNFTAFGVELLPFLSSARSSNV